MHDCHTAYYSEIQVSCSCLLLECACDTKEMSSTVPSSGELDRWVEVARKCEYLQENDLKVTKVNGAL